MTIDTIAFIGRCVFAAVIITIIVVAAIKEHKKRNYGKL